MAIRRVIAITAVLMVGSGLAGAWIAVKFHHQDAPTHALVPPPDTTPEKVVPYQSLTLQDKKGNVIGSIIVSDDSTVFHLSPTADVVAKEDGRTVFRLWKQDRGELWLSVDGQDLTCMSCPGLDVREPLFRQPAPKGLRQSIHDWISPPPQPKLAPKKPDDVVPTSDLRLVNKRGLRFATLGLTSSGDPAIALTDRSGNVQLVWVQRERWEEDWQELQGFDAVGHLRVSIERSGKASDLVLYDGNYVAHTVDTKTGKLVEAGSLDGGNEWMLKPADSAYQRPVALTDLRNKQVWKAP
jgi:hypothetical protein